MIDPISVILNPDIAYSIVLNDQKRQQVFNNAPQYIASITNTVAFTDGLIVDPSASIITPPAEVQKVFSDFRITSDVNQTKAGNYVNVSVEAVDQSGNLFESFSESINVVLSSATAQFDGVKTMTNGKTNFRIMDPNPGEVVMQVSNSGSISEEKKIVFSDYLKFLEITAPQKTTLGTNVAVGIRPVGTKGGVITDALTISAAVFPSIVGNSSVSVSGGRGEYLFKADKEGIYELAFSSEGISEKVQISVQKTEALVSVEPVVPETPVEDIIDETTSVPDETTPIEEAPKPAAEASPIVLLEGTNYKMYEVDGSTLIVFNDKDVTSEYPVEMKFDVPEGTETVSIFSGLNDRNFPDTGELKLSKYTPGQKTVRYYPKYVPEDSYKKIVAYKGGEILSSKIFTWSPAGVHAFTDVVEGVTDPEIYKAVKQLKLSNVVKGNPDGSYGITTPINRAATATLLIRAFYSDVNLDTLQVSSIAFKDVPKSSWYASAMWFASQSEYDGESKPVIIKGFEGKANPDGNVKLEEFVTMLLRLLEVPTPVTEPWYEGAIAKSIELGLITSAERQYIDKPLQRGLVARIMVKALELVQSGELAKHQVALPLEEAAPVEEAQEAVPEEEPVAVEPAAAIESSESVTYAARDLQYTFDNGSLQLIWDSPFSGPFTVYREAVGGNGEIALGNTGGKVFTDVSAQAGKQYYYRVGYQGEAGVQKAEILVSL
jgi:hypothetical protein